MLPKIWKKLLLAICIIACLFNVTAKLVNRISLEKVIASEQEGVNVRELLNITDEQPVVTKTKTNTNTISNYNNVETKPIVEEYNQEQYDNEEINSEENNEEQPIEEENNEEMPENEENNDFMNRIFNSSSFSDLIGN